MAKLDIKVPASKEEMEALRKTLSREVSLEEAENVTGGKTNEKGEQPTPDPCVCPYCGATIMCSREIDMVKHMNRCPDNPFIR